MQQQAAKRKRAKSPVLRSAGGAVPVQALTGRLRHSRHVVAHSATSSRPRQSFVPFTAHSAAAAQAPAQAQQTPFSWDDDDTGLQPDPQPQTERRNRHQQEREQRDNQWRQQIPELALRRTCRFHPDQDVSMAIGPWHARVHKASCQRQFGARRTPNSGLTFGDNIEHLWAGIRKHAHLIKYMSSASRQDFVTTLIWHLERLKEVRLAATLQWWFNDATKKRSELQLQLQLLEEASKTNGDLVQAMPAPMPMPVPKLTWKHGYQEALEKLNVLQPVADSSTGPDSLGSLPQLRFCTELHQASAAAVTLERKHNILSRWSQDSDEYQTACLERQIYHISQLQDKIVANLDWLRWAQLVISRTPRQHRGAASQLHKQQRQTRIKIKQAITHLQDWHKVLLDPNIMGYDAASLKAEDMEDAGWVIPWEQTGTLASSLDEQKAEAQHRIVRCDEELQIIARESRDMVSYYEQLVAGLSSALHACRAGQATLPADSRGVEFMHAHSLLDQEHFKLQYTQGQAHLLSEKLQRSELLLEQAKQLVASLDRSGNSESELERLTTTDQDVLPLSPQQYVQQLDPADVDVIDFGDLAAADAAVLDVDIDDAE